MMENFVQRLSKERHPISAGRAESAVELQQSIEQGHIFITFTDRWGGVELGIRLDEAATDLSNADFGRSTGDAHLEGILPLNYVTVRCVADVDLATLEGEGHLEVLE